MDRRHDHVRRRLPSELDDPLAQVSLDHLDAGRLERVVEEQLLRDHRLALRHESGPAPLAQVDDVAHGILGRGRFIDNRAGGLGGRLESRELGRSLVERDALGAGEPRALAAEAGLGHAQPALLLEVLEC